MAVFKFVISHAKQSVQVEKDQKDAPVLGKKIGDTLPGEFLGLAGYELLITGGSDKDGFPMRSDVEGQVRKKQILTKGHGFKTDFEGKRKRRIVRGNTIAQDISQINCKVVKAGEKGMHELLGITPKGAKEKKEVEGESRERAGEKIAEDMAENAGAKENTEQKSSEKPEDSAKESNEETGVPAAE